MKETDPRDVRFGYVAVKKEFVTSRQVIDALEKQFIEDLELGKHRLLGEILVDEGHMIQSQVNEVLEELGEKS
jgi:hypothetical protein